MEKVKERDGFSLMEMIIVIAILGMITGGIAVTYNMVRSADVKGMAYDCLLYTSPSPRDA